MGSRHANMFVCACVRTQTDTCFVVMLQIMSRVCVSARETEADTRSGYTRTRGRVADIFLSMPYSASPRVCVHLYVKLLHLSSVSVSERERERDSLSLSLLCHEDSSSSSSSGSDREREREMSGCICASVGLVALGQCRQCASVTRKL